MESARPGEHPLHGLRVMVLRPEGQAGRLANLLSANGAEPVAIPAVRIVPSQGPSQLDAVIDRLGAFEWLVFTSVNGADAFTRRLTETGRAGPQASAGIAAIGPATGARLQEAGLTVDWMPSAFTTRALAEELPMRYPHSSAANPPKVCLLRADIASTELDEALAKRGFDVERVNVYGTRPINAGLIKDAVRAVDAVALTSASIAGSFAAAAGRNLPDGLWIVSIGPATSEACRKYGVHVDAEAEEHTVHGLVEALKKHRRGA